MKKLLIIYYSWSNGNTERIAKMLQSETDSDILKIELNYNLRFWFAKLNSWEPILDKYKCYQLRF